MFVEVINFFKLLFTKIDRNVYIDKMKDLNAYFESHSHRRVSRINILDRGNLRPNIPIA